MGNTGDSDYHKLLKLLASIKGDSWVVESAVPAFLTTLELRLHDVLVDGYGFHPHRLIWKTPAKTFVSNNASLGRFDRRTLNTELVLLGILDATVDGTVKHIVLAASASSDMERLLRRERLPYSKLPNTLNADSSDAELRRALFGIVGRHPRFLWDTKLLTPEEADAREVVSEELTAQSFLDYFEDFTLPLTRKLYLEETLHHTINDGKCTAESADKAKETTTEEKARVRKENPRYFSHRVFAKPAIRAFVEPEAEALKSSPVINVEANPVLLALRADVVDFLVTSETTQPCFVIQCVAPQESEESIRAKPTVIDDLLKGAKIPSIHIPISNNDRDGLDRTVTFRLLTNLLFELHRRKLLLEEEKTRVLEQQTPNEDGEIELEDLMEVDNWVSSFEVSSDLFRFDREIADRAHREWKAVKATYCDAEFKVTRSEKNKEIRLAATLTATEIKPRDFACVRPLVTPGGNWGQFSGITKSTLNNLLILSMFMELKMTLAN
jgi:hypothetical protein